MFQLHQDIRSLRRRLGETVARADCPYGKTPGDTVRTMDTTGLLPQDLEATLRSLPRRYREILAPLRGPKFEQRVARTEGRDRSIQEICVDTSRTLGLIGHAIGSTITHESSRVPAAVIDRSLRDHSLTEHVSMDEVLADLDREALALADRLHDLVADEWLRTSSVDADPLIRSGPMDVGAMAAEAVSTGVDNLREMEMIARSVG